MIVKKIIKNGYEIKNAYAKEQSLDDLMSETFETAGFLTKKGA